MDLGAELIGRLGITPPAHVALVGGGGKTTLMLALCAEGRARRWRCAAGTTTRVGAWQVRDAAPFLHGGREGDKLVGLPTGAFDERFLGGEFDLLVVEADGSRGKVVKAPADHEPVIPSSVTQVIAVIGADALDRVIEDVAHRPMRTAALCGCGPYERLTPARAALLLSSPRGGRKSVPPTAQFAVAVTRIGERQQAGASRLVTLLGERGIVAIPLPLVTDSGVLAGG